MSPVQGFKVKTGDLLNRLPPGFPLAGATDFLLINPSRLKMQRSNKINKLIYTPVRISYQTKPWTTGKNPHLCTIIGVGYGDTHLQAQGSASQGRLENIGRPSLKQQLCTDWSKLELDFTRLGSCANCHPLSGVHFTCVGFKRLFANTDFLL